MDNRAIEKRDDFGLKVIERQYSKEKLASLISTPFQTTIKLPIENINAWRKLFNPSLVELAP